MSTDVDPIVVSDESAEMPAFACSATYSPEDNKLRVRSLHHLPRPLYERLRSAGFRWAPVQKVFVAPMWTPEREDLLLELCGDIEDEDTTLVDRAEERADRFETYQERRAADADSARKTVESIAEGIPLGQPILVGHHSERHARRDAERIENGMRRAVRLWETSKYWRFRAAGALRHAKYKERPDVRARRIKSLEAEQRKYQRRKDQASASLALWSQTGLTHAQAVFIAGTTAASFPVCPQEDGNDRWSAFDVLKPDDRRWAKCPGWTMEQVQLKAQEHFPRLIARDDRWIAHCENRLIYERAMLEEQGASDLLAPKARPKQLLLCNYRAENGLDIPDLYDSGRLVHYPQLEMTRAEYASIWKDYRGTRVVDNSHRVRTAYVGSGSARRLVCVFITDIPVHARPAPIDRVLPALPISVPREFEPPVRTRFDDLAEQLRAGVQVISAEQLFPTPKDLARRMIDLATRGAGCAGRRILEPSAGTGVLLEAAIDSATGADCCRTVAVEIDARLTAQLERRRNARLYAREDNHRILCRDFLSCGEELGQFDCVVMNPPFADGQDINHVTHALSLLKEGGRLVAIMSAGVTFRQDRRTKTFRELLAARGGAIEPLPDDTFSVSGTHVRTVMVTIDG